MIKDVGKKLRWREAPDLSRELERAVELCFPGCDPVGNAEFKPGQGVGSIPCFPVHPHGGGNDFGMFIVV